MKISPAEVGPPGSSPEPAASHERPGRPTEGLKAVVLRSLSWTAAARVFATVGNVIRYAVFARLLSPYHFGVVGAAIFVVDLLTRTTAPGFQRALVQQKDEIKPYLDTVWVTETVRGLFQALFLIAAAHPLAVFFRQGSAYKVFWAAAVLAMARQVQSPAIADLYRQMRFDVTLTLNVAEVVGAFSVGLVAILYFHDWRGLIVGVIAGQILRSGMSFWYYPYRPRIRFDLQKAKKMFKYGRWSTGTDIGQFAAQSSDNFVVSHLLGPKALGEYQMAFSLGEVTVGEFANAISLVTFSMIPRLSGRQAERHRLFVYTNLAAVAIGIGYTILMYQWGAPLLRFALGKEWLGALAPLRWLCIYGMFQGMLILARGFLDGLGAPSSSFQVTLIRAITLAIFIYPFTLRWGTSGAAIAGLVSVMMPLPYMFIAYKRANAER